MQRNRVWVVTFGVLALLGAAWLLAQHGPAWFPGCLFHRFTGLHCPGCGMTRAAYAALHGQIGEAFRFNPVGMILLPLASFGVGLQVIGWARGKALPFRLKVGRVGGWVIVGLVISFWVLRNLPWWPFTLLAPPCN
jgi:hypothetical protein